MGHLRKAVDDALALKDPSENFFDATVVHIQLIFPLSQEVRDALKELS